MKIYRIKKLPIIKNKTTRSVCVGLFDGVHKGHQQLIKKTVAYAKAHHLKASMFTFDPSPKNIIFKRSYPHLMSLKLKARIVESLGIEELIVLEFNQAIADLSPEQFITKIITPLNIKKMVVGYDFTYGKKGAGTAQTLLALKQPGFDVEVVAEIDYQHQKISSTRTLKAINEGNVKLASKLLGRAYTIEGKVIHGNGNGKKLGFPTANLNIGNYALPKTGVYAVMIKFEDHLYQGMANIGIHPTIKQMASPLLEVNIFNFNRDIYGKTLEVSFIEYLRDEQKFPSLKALVGQLKRDQSNVKKILKKHGK